jgi:DNA-binding NarL/FixJ family response regulator
MDELQLRAVICDDDPTACQVATMLAEECGFDVVAQTRMAVEAEDAVRATKAHVLVLDLSLFGPPGHELVPRLRASAPDCKVIVNTAFDTVGTWAKAHGVFAVVRKDEPGRLEDALHRAAADRRYVTRS